ncbi:hypothetical protein Thiosp_01305 [Thiorhodovibrio litoralis]|nr:hypothetical protein Thiosp_01305 [Thiorhodovibrio litoralis]
MLFVGLFDDLQPGFAFARGTPTLLDHAMPPFWGIDSNEHGSRDF